MVVADGRILTIGPSSRVPIPAGAHVLDGTSGYLIPGLWDMHVHLSNAGPEALLAALRHGVTGVRDLGCDLEELDGWRREIAAGRRLGPFIVRVGPMIDGPKPGAPFRITVTTAEEGREAVDALAAKGVDGIKMHNAVPREAFFAVAKEASARRLWMAVHLPFAVSAAEASDAGGSGLSLEHAAETLLESAIHDPVHPARTMKEALAANQGERGDALFARFAANGTWFTPNIVGYRGFTNGGDVSVGTRNSRYRVLDALIGITGAMHRAGVRLLAGSDFSDGESCIRPGIDLHDELEYFVRAGLTPMEALWTATAGPAEYLGLGSTRGGLRPGMAADMILLGGDPRRDIGNTRDIRAVIAAGRLVPLDDVERAPSVPVAPSCMR